MIFKSLKILFDIYRLVNFWIIKFYCSKHLIPVTLSTHTHTHKQHAEKHLKDQLSKHSHFGIWKQTYG